MKTQKNNINEKAEKIKNIMHETADKSKEVIRGIIAENAKYIGSALDTNKKMVDSIKAQFDKSDMQDTITPNLKKAFGKSVELAEDTLDSIINSYLRQMEMNVDFNTRIVDAVKDQNLEKILQLIHSNFEASRELTVKNTREILDFYNKHTNLALNFNEKFAETINTQMDTLFSIQSKGLNRFTEWASDWWKQAGRTEESVK